MSCQGGGWGAGAANAWGALFWVPLLGWRFNLQVPLLVGSATALLHGSCCASARCLFKLISVASSADASCHPTAQLPGGVFLAHKYIKKKIKKTPNAERSLLGTPFKPPGRRAAQAHRRRAAAPPWSRTRERASVTCRAAPGAERGAAQRTDQRSRGVARRSARPQSAPRRRPLLAAASFFVQGARRGRPPNERRHAGAP